MVAATPTEFPILKLDDAERQKKVLDRVKCLIISPEQQKKIGDVFLDEMRLGLAANPERKSSLLMENTFIPELPDGTESGEYLALDLGGTNIRVIYVKMVDGKIIEEIVDYFVLSEQKRSGPGKLLFDFLAECLAKFVTKRKLGGRSFKLGFSFSFRMTHRSLDVGILLYWTKSFDCTGVEGEDVVRMLNEAIQRRGDLDITATVILNDTTGTLMQGAYLDKRCALGMILGTGNNCCYIEKVKNIEKWLGRHHEEEMIVSTEWGAFGDNGVLDFIRTQWDRAVDEQSTPVHYYTFEKYFAGKYLGDLFREVLLTLAKEGFFCGGTVGKLGTHGAISTNKVSHIEEDHFQGTLEETREIIESLGLTCDEDDVRIAQFIAGILSYRGILLISILTGLLLVRMEHPHCSIAIDGSLARFHPRFKPLVVKLLSQFAPGRQFDLKLAHDGSGKGAALAASIAERLRKKRSS